MAMQIQIVSTIADVGSVEWNNCFPDEVENWDFYRATERSGIPGFSWFYIVVRSGGRLLAAVPGFTTDYRIDTTVEGWVKRCMQQLARWLPGLLTISMTSLGSPVAEVCHIGFAPEVAADQHDMLVALILYALEDLAADRRSGLVVIKDADPALAAILDRTSRAYKKLPGLPTALLPISATSLDGYLASLGRSTRKDMRRKLKKAAGIRIERRTDVAALLPEIDDLYNQTLARSDLRLEHLPAAFFTNLLDSMAGAASCFLYWEGSRLLAFNLVVEGNGRLIDKYIGMNYADVPRYSLYFVSWLNNVAYCISRGLTLYQAGQASYGPKLRLGCQLRPNHQYFRHRNPVANAVLRLVGRIAGLDRSDPLAGGLPRVPGGKG